MKGFVPLYVEIPKATAREINRRVKKCKMKKWEIVRYAVTNSPEPFHGEGKRGTDLIPTWREVLTGKK